MSLKLCFNSETHRASKLPVNYNALIQLINSIFTASLPSNWVVQYLDSEKGKTVIGNSEDYQAVLEKIQVNNSATIEFVAKMNCEITQVPLGRLGDKNPLTVFEESKDKLGISQEHLAKVTAIKRVFRDENTDYLLEFVSKYPSLSLRELFEVYFDELSKRDKNTALLPIYYH